MDEIIVKGSGGEFAVVGLPGSQTSSSRTSATDEAGALARTAAAKFTLDLHDEVLDRRFKNIVLAAVKGIRTETQTIDALTKTIAVGGLGLAATTAQQLTRWLMQQAPGVATATPVYRAAPSVRTAVVPRLTPAPARISVSASVAAQPIPAPAPQKPAAPVASFTREQLDYELAPPPPLVVDQSKVSPARPLSANDLGQGLQSLVRPSALTQALNGPAVSGSSAGSAAPSKVQPSAPLNKVQLPPKPAASPMPMPRRTTSPSIPATKQFVVQPLSVKPNWWQRVRSRLRRTPQSIATPARGSAPVPAASPSPTMSPGSRPSVLTQALKRAKVTDIQAPSRLVGPLQELQNFKLVDWRKLSAEPNTAIMRIKDKIDLLAKESITQKFAAVQAWRASEVHRLYLALGKESLERKLPLAAIIADRQRQNQPWLSANEFLALGKLNKMVEY
ncbi:hypothetical protein HY933_02540 [Candidatus Falkowbacteria bacterium]|nr:hypothetical protein [Candidatus Falkowbacteria bacterium]